MEIPEIEALYAVFAHYRLHDPVTSCYCGVCMGEKDNLYFQSTPLRLITPQGMVAYLWSAGIFDDGGNDFRYFFPRILEIIYLEGAIRYSAELGERAIEAFFEVVWERIKEAQYRSWEPMEIALVERFFLAYLRKYQAQNDRKGFDSAQDDLIQVGFTNASELSFEN